MKQIVKDQNTPDFDDWKASANDDWQPTYEGLIGTTKKEVKDSLMKEQGHICCYCERELSSNESHNDSHIEHFKPQSGEDVDPLDYANMLCSCQNQLKQGEPRHCGHLKGDWFDESLLISPLYPDCERHFKYTEDGEIQPARNSNDAAKITIKKLGLDIPKLNALRKKAIEVFSDENLSEQERSQFVSGYLKKKDDTFNEFWTTIDYIFVQNVQSKEC